MIVAGIILLLPGLCSLFFVYAGVATSASDLQFVGACVIVACFGVGKVSWLVETLMGKGFLSPCGVVIERLPKSSSP